LPIEQNYLDEFNYFGDRIYLDCSTMGMPPQRTRDLAKRYMDAFYDSLWRDPEIQGESLRDKARGNAAKLIHADPADIFFTKNTTEGNNLLSQRYPLEAGDEVLVHNEDFPAVYMPWTIRQRSGVKLTVVKGKNGVVSADDMIAHFSGKTRIVAVSMAQSSSGYVTDLVKLGKACRERGILLSVDAVQAAGRLPIDVEAMNIDVLASSSFKGLMGIMGAGFCWCRREVMDRIEPPVVSGNINWDTYVFHPGFESLSVPEFPSGAARMETGTANNLGIAMMAESIGMLNEIGIENIAAQIREVETYYRSCLKKAGLPIQMLGSDDPDTWSGSVSFLYDQERKKALAEALEQAGICAAVRNYFRVSFHFYNTKAQVDRLIPILERILG
jgi:selenocysteine lyase/cysteine desulfurase